MYLFAAAAAQHRAQEAGSSDIEAFALAALVFILLPTIMAILWSWAVASFAFRRYKRKMEMSVHALVLGKGVDPSSVDPCDAGEEYEVMHLLKLPPAPLLSQEASGWSSNSMSVSCDQSMFRSRQKTPLESSHCCSTGLSMRSRDQQAARC